MESVRRKEKWAPDYTRIEQKESLAADFRINVLFLFQKEQKKLI